jgi:hypothetical protein
VACLSMHSGVPNFTASIHYIQFFQIIYAQVGKASSCRVGSKAPWIKIDSVQSDVFVYSVRALFRPLNSRQLTKTTQTSHRCIFIIQLYRAAHREHQRARAAQQCLVGSGGKIFLRLSSEIKFFINTQPLPVFSRAI